MSYSAIGYYVHYYASNYLTYGVQPKRKTGGHPVNQGTWLNLSKQLRSYIPVGPTHTQIELEKLSKEYNDLRDIIRASTNEDTQKIREKITQLVSKYSHISQDQLNIDWDTGNVELSLPDLNNIMTSTQSQAKSRLSRMAGKIATYANTVQSHITAAQKIVDTIKNTTVKAQLQSVVTTAQTSLQAAIETGLAGVPDDIKKHISTNKQPILKKTAEQIISSLSIVKAAIKSSNLSVATGVLEELTGTVVKLMAGGCANDTIVKILEDHYKNFGGGKQTTGTYMSHNLVSVGDYVRYAMRNGGLYVRDAMGNKYSYLTLYKSAQKADVVLEYNIDANTKKTAALSIKNYNLSNRQPLGLVANSPLSTFLFNMDNVDTINHFLNIFAAHPDGNTTTFLRCQEVAYEGFAYYLLYTAMTGKGVGKLAGFADVLVVNDKSKPDGVKMYDINTLVNKVMQKNLLHYVQISPAKLLLDNTFVPITDTLKSRQSTAIATRLVNLVNAAHAQKISVSLNPQVLNI